MKHFAMIFVLVLLHALGSISIAQIYWTRDTLNNPIFADSILSWNSRGAFGPCVIFNGTTYHMWYMGYDGTSTRIGYATSTDGLHWVPDSSNPVLDLGPPGSWDETWVLYPYVLYRDSVFQMWYSGIQGELNTPGYRERIGYATSPDGIHWTKADSVNPVLDVGASGEWDDHGIDPGSVFYDGQRYHLWYGGYRADFKVRTGYATSPDGIHWTKADSVNPVLDLGIWDYGRVHQARVLFDGNSYHMFYGGGDYFLWRIGYAKSHDGITWIKNENNPVLGAGLPGSWESRYVAVPSVMFDTTNSIYRLWYAGGYTSLQGSIGYATAAVTYESLFDYDVLPQLEVQFTDKSIGIISTWLWNFGDGNTSTEINPLHTYNQGGNYIVTLTVNGPYGSDDSTHQIVVTGLAKNEGNIPLDYGLKQNYPNPFNPTTSIKFSIPKSEFVTLKIYNILGEEVETLVSERLAAGKYKYDWDAGWLASGVYLYRIQAGQFGEAKKMVLLR